MREFIVTFLGVYFIAFLGFWVVLGMKPPAQLGRYSMFCNQRESKPKAL